MERLLLVCAGGALGSGARYLVSLGAARLLGDAFPFGTLAVNVVGSFVIAVVVTAAADTAAVSPDLRLFLATGVVGGFTTYSSFNHELLTFAARGLLPVAGLYLGLTWLGCLASGAAGVALVRWLA